MLKRFLTRFVRSVLPPSGEEGKVPLPSSSPQPPPPIVHDRPTMAKNIVFIQHRDGIVTPLSVDWTCEWPEQNMNPAIRYVWQGVFQSGNNVVCLHLVPQPPVNEWFNPKRSIDTALFSRAPKVWHPSFGMDPPPIESHVVTLPTIALSNHQTMDWQSNHVVPVRAVASSSPSMSFFTIQSYRVGITAPEELADMGTAPLFAKDPLFLFLELHVTTTM